MGTDPMSNYAYQSGFGNHHESEAIKGALPVGQNSPQVCPLGLYAEQLSGTAFTVPRHQNQRTWLYRIRPSVCHEPFEPYDGPAVIGVAGGDLTPNQLRWDPFPIDGVRAHDFVDGLRTVCGAGDPASRNGLAVHIYTANASMMKRALNNSDGDLLFGIHRCIVSMNILI